MDVSVRLSADYIENLPRWEFNGWRFYDLGEHNAADPFIVVPDFRLPVGWRFRTTVRRDGHLYAAFQRW